MQKSDIRCSGCKKLLARGQVIQLQIKCPRCKALNNLSAPSAFKECLRASNLQGAQHATKTNRNPTAG